MRRFFTIFLLLSFTLLLALPVQAADGSTVDSLTAQVLVAEDGTCSVTLTAQVSFVGAPTTFLMPLHEDAGDVTATGGQYKVRSYNGVRCAVYSNASGFVGTQTFVCTYNLPCAVDEDGSTQTFRLDLLQRGFDYSISNYKLEIQFPARVTQQPTLESAYYGDVVDNVLSIRVQEQNLTLTSVAPVKDRETISMALEFTTGSFDLHYLPGGITSFNQLAFYLLFLIAIIYWAIRIRGKLLLPKQQVTADMEATAGECDCRLYGKQPDIAAVLAHWGNLGYVGIFRNERGRIILRKQMEMGNERKASEQKLFRAIFRGGNTCDLQSLHFRTACKPAAASIRSSWVRRLFDPKAGSPAILRGICLLAAFFTCLMCFDLWLPAGGWRWVFLPLLSILSTLLCAGVQYCFGYLLHRRRIFYLLCGVALSVLLWLFGRSADCGGTMILNLLLQFLCALSLLFGGKRSLEGEVQVSQLLGLRRRLRKGDKEENARLLTVDGQHFYRMLPFAETLGVGRAYCKGFDSRRLEPCPWLGDAKYQPETVKEFYALYKEITTAIRGEELPDLTRLFRKKTRTPVGRK